MKKIVGILVMLGMTHTAFAQSANETVNWLDQNISKIDHVNCASKQLYGNHLEINQKSIKLYDDKQSCKIDWDNVKEITKDDLYFYITSNEKLDNKNIALKVLINDQSMKKRYLNALNHLISINSKNLVKNDLF